MLREVSTIWYEQIGQQFSEYGRYCKLLTGCHSNICWEKSLQYDINKWCNNSVNIMAIASFAQASVSLAFSCIHSKHNFDLDYQSIDTSFNTVSLFMLAMRFLTDLYYLEYSTEQEHKTCWNRLIFSKVSEKICCVMILDIVAMTPFGTISQRFWLNVAILSSTIITSCRLHSSIIYCSSTLQRETRFFSKQLWCVSWYIYLMLKLQ